MEASLVAELDAQYRQLREECGLFAGGESGFIAVEGGEAAEYLQGQLTNDIEAIDEGKGAYAALLDRKARIQTDMSVLRLDRDRFLLRIDPGAVRSTFKHLDMYRIGRDVEVTDRSGELSSIRLAGPAAERFLPTYPRAAHEHLVAAIEGTEVRIETTPIGSIPAFELIATASDREQLARSLTAAGVPEVEEEALEVLRVEAGIPRYGYEITAERMPAEVGIVERAVNFEKGCYIGQEPVARLHYRGRPNRRLCSLELSEAARPGAALELDGKQVGELTSFALSPAHGPIGLAIVRREAEAGAELEVAGGARATVGEPA